MKSPLMMSLMMSSSMWCQAKASSPRAKNDGMPPGSMVFAPAGVRGTESLSRLTVLGIQEPH